VKIRRRVGREFWILPRENGSGAEALPAVYTMLASLVFAAVGFAPQSRVSSCRSLARNVLRAGIVTCTAEPPEIDLTGDGGVMKRVLRSGSGELPLDGARVVVHYEGRLANGKVFDSTRFRDKTFKFDLGEGRVIKGWEEGLSSMQVGELSVLTCAPEYAYGAEGNPPGIPPAAVLTFEVEFVSMIQPRVEAPSSSGLDLEEYLDDDDFY
jgi:hypothetical protein